MAQLTVGVKVNSGQLKTLGKVIDDTVSKVGNLNNALSSIGTKVNTSGLKGTDAALADLMNNAKQTQSGIEKIAQNVNTNGLTGIDAILAQINNQAQSATSTVSKIGQDVSVAGLEGIDAKLAQLVKTAQATQSSISKMGQNVDSSGVDALGSKIDNLTNKVSGQLGGAFNTVLGAIGGKSLSDLTIFNAMDKEVNKVLIKNLGDSTKQATSYWNTIDKATDNSLVSMRQAVPAINAIQRATQVSGTQMESASGNVIAFGSYIQSLTGSSALAETAMFSLSKGIKGAYASLDQYGITEASLKATGKWAGDEKDVKGFTDAVVAATGALEMQDQLMNTSKGKLTQIYKQLSVEGAKAGADILSALQPVIDGFISLNKAAGGVPAKLVIIGAAGLTSLALLSPLLSSIQSIGSFFGGVGKAAPAMGKGAGSMNLMAKYMQIGSMGITEMVVPMLKIAAVVAIALPVAAALAAEAMVLLKLLQMLFKALAFDKIDIGKSVDSIYDLAKGFAGMALAFGALTVVNIANVVYMATGGIIGTIAALTHFTATIAVSIPIINKIASMPDIDSNISGKLEKLNKALAEITGAIKSMDTVSSTQFNWNPLTNYTKAIEQAKSDIIGSVTTINSMGSMANVNTMAVDKIKQISTALGSVAEAVKSMDSVSSAQFNWNPLTNFTKALDQARSDIGHASESLRGYDTLANIPPTASNKIKATADALKNVATAIKSLDEVSKAQFNWNPLTNFIKSMEQARYDIGQSSVILAGYSTLANIPEGVGNKIQRVAWTLNTVKTALTNLGNLNNTAVELDLSGFLSRLQTARTDIGHASVILAGFNTIANMPEGVGGKLQRMSWTMHTVKTAIDNLATLNTATVNVDLSGFISRLQTVRTQIGQASIILAGFNTLAVINSDAVSKVNSVKTASTSVTQAVNSLNTIPAPQGTNVTKAVTTIKKAMDELNKLTGKKLSANISGIATSVTNAISKITAALNQGAGVQPAARNLGTKIGTGLKSGTSNLRSVASSAIQNGVSAISGKAGAARSAGHSVGAAAVAGFKSGLNSGSPGDIARIMAKEIGVYVPQLVWRQIGAVQSMMARVGKEATKAEAKGSGRGSPGDVAKAYKTEVGKYIPMMIRQGIPAVKQAMKELATAGTTELLKGLKISDVISKNSFVQVFNSLRNVASSVASIAQKTVDAKSATTQFAKAWIDAAKKIRVTNSKGKLVGGAEYEAITASKKAYTSLIKLMKTSKSKKKLVFDKKDIALLKVYTSTASKTIKANLKTATAGIKNKKVIADIKKNAGAIGKSYKQLNDSNYANDSAALDKMLNTYKSYYAKLDKAEKKKAKTTIDNIKKTIQEQKKVIKESITEINTAISNMRETTRINKNLNAIVGTQAEIEKYSKLVAEYQEKLLKHDSSFKLQTKKQTDSQYLKYLNDYYNTYNTINALLEEYNQYLSDATSKAEEYALAMEDAANSTSALGDTKEDLMALAKSFNKLNQNTVDIDLNMSGAIDLLSNDPKYAGLDKNKISQLILDVIKKELLS